jgi:hypothetical protein
VKRLFLPFLVLGRVVRGFVLLIRDGDDDLHGTYPDIRMPTGEEAASGSAFASVNW